MMGLLLGIPSMALSQAFSDRNAARWDTARAVAPKVIMQFARGTWSQGLILNINSPEVPVDEVGPIELTTQGTGLMEEIEVISAIDPRSLEYHWVRLRRSARRDVAGSETFAIGRGRVSVTPLQFERTNQSISSRLTSCLDRMMSSGSTRKEIATITLDGVATQFYERCLKRVQ